MPTPRERSDPPPVREALRELLRDHPGAREALVPALLRLAFLLQAEDRGLAAAEHGVGALHRRLRADASRGPGALAARGEAWPALLSLLRRGPGGRASARRSSAADHGLAALRLRDDAVWRLLAALRGALDGEVEQLGGVYESLMGAERRRSGAYYTPRALTAPIVRTALEPLLAALAADATPEQILGLRVCDPAMGSGAFLLEACRQLGDRLAHAMARCAPPTDDLPHRVSTDDLPRPVSTDDLPHRVSTDDLTRRARRLVADHCLHGVDRDPQAVDLAARSLWLLTAAPGDDLDLRPRALKRGDSLVGLGPAQLAALPADGARGLADAAVATFFARGGPVDAAPFHWSLEFPQVFARPGPGFDCFVGNPPFLGGKRISTVLGRRTRDWLSALHPGASSNTDLSAHFFRRAFDLLRPGGTCGLVATNTLAQGDTQRGGLAWLCEHGATIYAARTQVAWPGDAAVVVCVVHLVKGALPGPYALDGAEVPRISAFLRRTGGDRPPAPLRSNHGRSFTGCDLKGPGFTFDDARPDATPTAVLRALVERDPGVLEIVRPYLGGEDINTDPRQAPRRHLIHFGDRDLEAARAWPELLAIVEARVLPRRRAMGRELAAWPWWQFWRTRARLAAATRGRARVLVNSQVTAHLAFVLVPADRVFAHTVNVFADDHPGLFALLQSRLHELWARAFGSSLADRLRYTPSDCFETFPLADGWAADAALRAAGERYHDARAALMLARDEGLTTTYNRFHDPRERDPRVLELRELHADLDRAALTAHGWPDLAARATCEFREDSAAGRPPRLRWPPALVDEALARLLALHRERAAAEAGSHEPPP